MPRLATAYCSAAKNLTQSDGCGLNAPHAASPPHRPAPPQRRSSRAGAGGVARRREPESHLWRASSRKVRNAVMGHCIVRYKDMGIAVMSPSTIAGLDVRKQMRNGKLLRTRSAMPASRSLVLLAVLAVLPFTASQTTMPALFDAGPPHCSHQGVTCEGDRVVAVELGRSNGWPTELSWGRCVPAPPRRLPRLGKWPKAEPTDEGKRGWPSIRGRSVLHPEWTRDLTRCTVWYKDGSDCV